LINKTRKNDIGDVIDYQIPVTQLKECEGDSDIQAPKRVFTIEGDFF